MTDPVAPDLAADAAEGPAPTDLAYAVALDAADPLAPHRHRFRRIDPDLVYLDGNSLGMLPLATERRLADAVSKEWGDELVRGWQHWVDLPIEVGDRLGSGLLGAGPGQVLICDSITVNLYKLARAALAQREGAVVIDDDNFPTDRYVLAGVAAEMGRELRVIRPDPVTGISQQDLTEVLASGDVALVSLSHVAYRSGALLDLRAVTRQVHEAGAYMLWDLAHSAGSVPVDLDAAGVDMAVGCTYKYLNAGPGAPAFLYVNRRIVDALTSPIHGWWSQTDMFAMGETYVPALGIARFHAGSPPILGIRSVDEGVRQLADVGIDAIRSKSVRLTDYLIALADAWLVDLGLEVASPRDSALRGGHVVLAHPDAYRISVALVDRGVVPDFRAPDLLRLGVAALTTSFVDVHEGMRRLRDLVTAKEHERVHPSRSKVT